MLDCIEIDGASNNGVENVRDLIEKARFEPNQGKYKVYIIDEVHMLSTGAFNALLKILEEPPTHVKFILATTEIEKVPETIRSRTLRFDFRKITREDIITRLEYIAGEEKIEAEREAIELIARVARGGLRDAITLFEQNIIDSEVTVKHVRHTLSLIEDDMIDEIIETLRVSDISKIFSLLEDLGKRHTDARGLLEQLLYKLRDLLFEYIDDPKFYEYQEVFGLIMEWHAKLKSIPDGMMLLEITFLKIVKRVGSPIVEKNEMREQKQKNIGSGFETASREKKKETWWEQKNGESKGATLFERRWKQWGDERQQSVSEFVDPSGAFGTFHSWKVQTQDNSVNKTRDSWTSQEWKKLEASQVIQDSKTPTLQDSTPPGTKTFSFPILINHFRETNPALMTDLKTARFQVEGEKLILIFWKGWNHGRVNTPKVKNEIIEATEKLGMSITSLECSLATTSGNDLNIDEIF